MNLSGGTHRNFGSHGCASSTAADSLAAVKHFIYDEKSIAPGELLDALEKNFAGYEELRAKLRSSGHQVGCGSELADEMLKLVFDAFGEVFEEAGSNGFGGKFRPGTGSALNYVLMTQTDCRQRIHATADGRLDGEYISSSLAPAPGVKASGILSVLTSFSAVDYSRICNGGPITMELDPVYFKSEDAVEKMITFLRAFIRSGNQQLQLNTLDADLLRKAQQNPAAYRDLIVRVWGWSGYFVELDKVYQDQIIARQAFKG
jgi:formate C-acetyltransferase